MPVYPGAPNRPKHALSREAESFSEFRSDGRPSGHPQQQSQLRAACMKNGVMGNSPVDQAVIGQVTDELTLQAVRGSHVAAKGTAC